MSAQPASAVTCSGYGCDGWDPQETGCSADAVTVASAPIWDSSQPGVEDGLVELRWSATCGTNWTRVTSYVVDPLSIFDGYVYRYSDGAEQPVIISGVS